MRLAVVLVVLAACAADEPTSSFDFTVRIGAVPDGVSDVLVDGAPQPIDDTTYPTRTIVVARAFADYDAATAAPPITLEFRDVSGTAIDVVGAAPGACARQCPSCDLTLESVTVTYDRLYQPFDCFTCQSVDGMGFGACY